MLHCIWAHCCANAKLTLLFGIMDLFELFVGESYNEISYLCNNGSRGNIFGTGDYERRPDTYNTVERLVDGGVFCVIRQIRRQVTASKYLDYLSTRDDVEVQDSEWAEEDTSGANRKERPSEVV